MRILFAAAVALTFLTPLARAQSPASVPKDVVLVLDNSGSMRKSDPGFLAREAVTTFIGGLDQQTRVQIVIFDETVRVAVPFTAVTEASRPQLLASLERIDYRGRFTDSPAAMERAVYDLKTQGRDGVEKLVVFMTDGIVDTGDAARDAQAARWLREDLAADAALAGVRIFAIAFTDQADFQLIQSLARRTDGEYFRALSAPDLQGVFERIDALIAAPEPPAVPAPEEEPAPAYAKPEAPLEVAETGTEDAAPAGLDEPGAQPAEPAAMAAAETGQGMTGPEAAGEVAAGAIEVEPQRGAGAEVAGPGPMDEVAAGAIEAEPQRGAGAGIADPAPYSAPEAAAGPALTPEPSQPAAPEAPVPVPDVRILLALAAIALAGVVLLVVVLALVVRRQRGAAAVPAARAPPAYLNDVQGVTREPAYEIGTRPLMLGRVAGTDREHDYIVINRSTVGRRHARIEYRDPDFWIVDQGSINGTFVNGERVSGERRLEHGDRIRLHQFEFEFMVPAAAGASASQVPGAARDDSGLQTVVGTVAAVAAARPAAGIARDAEAEFFDSSGEGAVGDATQEHAHSFSGGDTAVLDAAPVPEAVEDGADFFDLSGEGAVGDATQEHAHSFSGGDTAVLDAAPVPAADAASDRGGEPAAPVEKVGASPEQALHAPAAPEPGSEAQGSPDTFPAADIDLFGDTGAGLTAAGEAGDTFTNLFGAADQSEPQGEADTGDAQLEPEPRPPISTIVLDLSDDEPAAQPAPPAGEQGPAGLDAEAGAAEAAPAMDTAGSMALADDDLFGAGADRDDGGVAAQDGMADEELSLDEFIAAAGFDGGEDLLPGSGDAGEGGDERVPVPGQLDDRSPQS